MTVPFFFTGVTTVGNLLSTDDFQGAVGGKVGSALSTMVYEGSTWGATLTGAEFVPPSEQPPDFIGAGDGAARATAGVLSVPYPLDIDTGDYLILHAMVADATTAISFADFGSPISGPDAHAAGTDYRDWLFVKVASGSETGNADSNNIGASILRMARIYCFRGVDTGGTPYEALGVSPSASSTTVQDYDLTTLGTNRLACNFFGIPNDSAIAAFTGETGGDWVEAVAEYTTDLGTDGCLQLQISDMPTAGTIAGGTTTISTSERVQRYKLALLPV
jgi:hypothetical protein